MATVYGFTENGLKEPVVSVEDYKEITVESYLQQIGSIASKAIVDGTFDVSKEGYTALGVVGQSVMAGTAGQVNFSGARVSNDRCIYSIYNSGSSAVSNVEFSVAILYVEE